jgi:putative transposase
VTRLSHTTAASTVQQILHDARIDPAPRRTGQIWRRLMTTQTHRILAPDFVHADTVPPKQVYALILIQHGTRRIHLLGVSANPDGTWTTQAARDLVTDPGGRASQFKFMNHNHGGQFTNDFDTVLADAGIPPTAPYANSAPTRRKPCHRSRSISAPTGYAANPSWPN